MTWAIVDGVLYGADDEVARWVDSRCGNDKPGLAYKALGVVARGNIVAGIIFHGFQEDRDVTATVAIDGAGLELRSGIKRCLEWAFVALAVPRISAEIDMRNKRSRRLAEGVGFRLEGVKRGASRRSGICVYGMLKEDLRL